MIILNTLNTFNKEEKILLEKVYLHEDHQVESHQAEFLQAEFLQAEFLQAESINPHILLVLHASVVSVLPV